MKRIIASLLAFVLFCLSFVNILQATEQSSTDYNVLLITNEKALNGDTITEMISDIGKSYDISVTNIKKDASTSVTAALKNAGVISVVNYSDIIIQDSYDNLFNSNWDIISDFSTINDYLTDDKSKCYIGTSWNELSDTEKKAVFDKCDAMFSDYSINILKRVYDNLLEVKNEGIEVTSSNGTLTKAGELTLACTYITEITQTNIEGLTSYDGIADNSVALIVDKVNSTINLGNQKTANLTSDSSEEQGEETDDEEDTLISSKNVNREPIIKFIGNDAKQLEIQIYDYEQAGIKRAEIRAESASGDLVQEFSDDKTQSYKFQIDSSKYLKEGEYKKFYVEAEDSDGCILTEYFKVKLLNKIENGSYYKINRAPRVRPQVSTNETESIALAVQDSTGVMSIIPKTAATGNYKEVNLYADGKYNGFSGIIDIEDAYNWQNIKSKTTTSSVTYIENASTEFISAEDFFKVDQSKLSSSDKVLINIGNNKYKFKIYTKDATGLVSEKTMIITLGKDDYTESSDGDDVENEDSNTNNNTVTKTTTTKSKSESSTKTTKKTTTLGNLKADQASLNYTTFKTDREPRLNILGSDPDYIYIKIKDCGGIRSELTGDKKNQPKVYTCTDKKGNGKKEITDLKRTKSSEYKKQGTTYVYMVGIPSKYVGDNKSYFYIVAYDTSQYKNVIREYFGVTRKKDGTYAIDRAPRSTAVTTTKNLTQIGFICRDYSGISKIKVRTLKDKGTDTLGEWNGTIQKNWSQVESTNASKSRVTVGITTMTKVSSFFKSRSWKGKNPNISGKKGIYRFVIDTLDASGMTSTKTMVVDTTQYKVGNEYEKITSKQGKDTSVSIDTSNGEIALDRNILMIDNTHYNIADMKVGINSSSEYKAKDVTWTIDDTSVAKFQKGGKNYKKISGSGSARVVGLKFGTTTISAKLPNGSTAKCKLKVITSSKEQAKGDTFVNWQHGSSFHPFYLHKGTWGNKYVEAYVNNAAKIVKKYQDSKFKNEAAKKTVWCYRQKSLKFSVDSKKKKVTGISGNEYGVITPIGHWDFQETGKIKKKGELSPNNYILLFTSKNQWAYVLQKDSKTGEWKVVSSRESAAGYNRDTFEGYLCIMKKEGFIGPAVTYERWGRGESSYQNAVHKDFTSVQGQPQSAGCIRVGFTDQEIYYWVFVKAGVGTRLILF